MAQTPSRRQLQQHTRMGTNTLMPPTIFNDRGAYDWSADRTIVTSLNYAGNLGVFPSAAPTSVAGAGLYPIPFQAVGVSDAWATNYATCNKFDNFRNYSWTLAQAWGGTAALDGLQMNLKLKLNSLPPAPTRTTFLEIGNNAANRGLVFRIANITGNNQGTVEYNTGTTTTTMWNGALVIGTWYSLQIYITQGTPLINLYANVATGPSYPVRLNNGPKNWTNVLTTDRLTIGANWSNPEATSFDGWITDFFIWRQRNGLFPSGGNFFDTTFI